MPNTIFTSFPLNLSILLQNENNSWLPVAEGKTLPQKVLEDWIAQNATELDREADSLYRKTEALLALPDSECVERFKDIRQALVDLADRESALAARHLAALDMSPFNQSPLDALEKASIAIKNGCDPAWYEFLKAYFRTVPKLDHEYLHRFLEDAVERDECALLMAEHLNANNSMVDADVLPALRDSLLRQAREGSVDALRLLFLALTMDKVPVVDGLVEEVYALLCDRAKTDIFCARLLAQYKLQLVRVLESGMFGDEAPGEDEQKEGVQEKGEQEKDALEKGELEEDDPDEDDPEEDDPEEDDPEEDSLDGSPGEDLLEDPQDMEAFVDQLAAPFRIRFEHGLEPPKNWAMHRTHLVHAADLGDPWSELVLHVYDAMCEDCPHDAMARLRELAHTKNYPPAKTFLGALSYNRFALKIEGNGGDETSEGPDLATENGRCELAEYLKEAALAMPENPCLERIWLDFELLASTCYASEHPGEEPEIEWGLTREEIENFDPRNPDDPLYPKAMPEFRFARRTAPGDRRAWYCRIDFLADLPTSNPHLAAIRDRAVANSPYAAFLLGRALVGGAFGEPFRGGRCLYLLEACLDFALNRDVEEAIAFYWAHLVGNLALRLEFKSIDMLFHYRMERYNSLCRLLYLMQSFGLWKWYLDARPNMSMNFSELFKDMNMEHELSSLVLSRSLIHEPMGTLLASLKIFRTLFHAKAPIVMLNKLLKRVEDSPQDKERQEREQQDKEQQDKVQQDEVQQDKVQQDKVQQERIRQCWSDKFPDPFAGVCSLFARSIRMAMLVYDLPTLLLAYAALHHAVHENFGAFEKRDLQIFFSALDGDNRDFEKPLRHHLKTLMEFLQLGGVEMTILRANFENLDTTPNDREMEKDREKRKARKKERKRVKKGRRK